MTKENISKSIDLILGKIIGEAATSILEKNKISDESLKDIIAKSYKDYATEFYAQGSSKPEYFFRKMIKPAPASTGTLGIEGVHEAVIGELSKYFGQKAGEIALEIAVHARQLVNQHMSISADQMMLPAGLEETHANAIMKRAREQSGLYPH